MSMTLRLSAEADAALKRLAKAQGVSKNEAAVRAILDHAADVEREELIEAAMADTLSRYSSTLKRLGE
jgi:predicted transcriptional regulator